MKSGWRVGGMGWGFREFVEVDREKGLGVERDDMGLSRVVVGGGGNVGV